MTPQEVYDYYGSGYRIWKATGLAQGNVTYWFKKGYIPINSQAVIHRATKGALKIDLDLTITDDTSNADNGIKAAD